MLSCTWQTHIVMLLTVFTTLLLWAGLSFPSLTNTFGDPAIVGLFFIAVPFGSGFLTKEDFNGLVTPKRYCWMRCLQHHMRFTF